MAKNYGIQEALMPAPIQQKLLTTDRLTAPAFDFN